MKLCVVVGKPASVVGEIPKAFIVLKDSGQASEAEIIVFVKEKVAPYKAVREVEFRQQLPISGAGKVRVFFFSSSCRQSPEASTAGRGEKENPAVGSKRIRELRVLCFRDGAYPCELKSMSQASFKVSVSVPSFTA